MMDLNDHVPDDYADHLYTANDINNLGQITGYTVKAGTEESLAFWACRSRSAGIATEHSAAARNDAKRVPLPAEARQLVLARAGAADAQLAR